MMKRLMMLNRVLKNNTQEMKPGYSAMLCCFGVLGVFLTGCGSSVSQQVHNTVQENQKASTIIEWETSPSHPDVIFEKWRTEFNSTSSSKEALRNEICAELKELNGQELSIFENHIRDQENQDLLVGCKDELLKKLDLYFANQRTDSDANNFSLHFDRAKKVGQFQDLRSKRDYSQGYLAITGDVGPKEVVLTFDDGPSPEYTRRVLEALKAVNAKAHFFELAKAVRIHPELTQRVASLGHMIGSHTVNHFCIGNIKECGRANGGKQFTFAQAVAEIKGGHQAVFDVLGWVDPIFRFPYGASSLALREFLSQNGTGEFFWNIDSEDWKAQSNQNLIAKTLARLESQGRGIILFHDIQRRTAEILPEFLSELYNRGYSIVLLEPSDPSAKYKSKLIVRKLP